MSGIQLRGYQEHALDKLRSALASLTVSLK